MAAIKLFRDCHQSLAQSQNNFDYNLMCQVVNKCEQLYDTQLKDIRVIQKLKTDIDFTKKNFYVRIKNVTLENLCLFASVFLQQKTEEFDNIRIVCTKNIQDALANKTFLNANEISPKLNEKVKECVKLVDSTHQIKQDLGKNPSPKNLDLAIRIFFGFLQNLEDMLSTVVYSFFFLRVVPPDRRTLRSSTTTSSSPSRYP